VKSVFSYQADQGRHTPICLPQDGTLCSLGIRVVSEGEGGAREFGDAPGAGYSDSGFSVMTDPGTGGHSVRIRKGDVIQYRVRMQIKGLVPEMILLATPVFDDATIYYSSGVTFLTMKLK